MLDDLHAEVANRHGIMKQRQEIVKFFPNSTPSPREPIRLSSAWFTTQRIIQRLKKNTQFCEIPLCMHNSLLSGRNKIDLLSASRCYHSEIGCEELQIPVTH